VDDEEEAVLKQPGVPLTITSSPEALPAIEDEAPRESIERKSIGDECTLEINQHNTSAMDSLQSAANSNINMIKEVVDQNQNANAQNEFAFIIQGI
jgi:hypothetical protein